ncbi:hypothetical protein AB670_01539 [Chryseobacterium sp. MOF25P]|uniref:phenylacetate--CoA ligase family protein n=1 Tax=unclassified Chryseobacterium TaxID=2593645 RepID=UPI00080489A1|nr:MULTISPECIES: phenylacetate--CoA ligase family protein [unclassified Chryseobacterium]OBW42119.1 hypothetical protein AB670_01539 [Chryseobacterium sp. MOF25P]OBW45484.1 hypothetical protein AB671_02444 [Chryseobacterium sp. BGARF1]
MKKIYTTLPEFLQNIILTIVNNYKYYQKYNVIPFIRPFSKIIENLNVDDFNDNNTLNRINLLINYATNHVPYYIRHKNYYKKINNLSDLKQLPILKKETLKEFNQEFISKESNRFNSYKYRTSGSTGTPIFGSIKNSELKMRLTMFLISLKLGNVNYSKPVARFPGADLARNGKVYRQDFINKHLLFSIYHLSNDKIFDYYNALRKFKIEILEGYPSTIISLVRLLKMNNLKLPDVKHVLTTAEKLLDYQRQEIEDFFECEIFDFYGSSEGSVYMFSNGKNGYLNCNKIGYFECVDENYSQVKFNQSGRMLITSFSSSFTPLIRYDIGDYATIDSEVNSVIRVKEIQGRQEEIFITPQGKAFGRFSLILKYLPSQILESQLVLTQQQNTVLVEYVCKDQLDKSLFNDFEDKMKSLLETNFVFEYKAVSNFEKSKRGKLSAVKILK